MSGETPQSPGDESGARSFSRGMGLINQVVGGSVFLASFCLCCGLTFLIRPDPTSSIGPSPMLGSTIVLITTIVGAAALAAFGLGMQTDRGWRPAVGATSSSLLMAVLYAIPLLGWLGPHSQPSFLEFLSLGLCMVAILMTVLNVIACAEVISNPPASTEPPTVRSEDFPDPWAEDKERFASPTREAIAKRRRKLEREIEKVNRLERAMEGDEADPPGDDEPQ